MKSLLINLAPNMFMCHIPYVSHPVGASTLRHTSKAYCCASVIFGVSLYKYESCTLLFCFRLMFFGTQGRSSLS